MQVGKQCQVSATVETSMLESTLGGGDVGVYATPAMIALMERAATECARSLLGEGETTVGTHMEVSHISAAPVGDDVMATAEIIKIEGRKLLFKVFCEDREGIIGKGTHSRLIVNRERFEQRAAQKRMVH